MNERFLIVLVRGGLHYMKLTGGGNHILSALEDIPPLLQLKVSTSDMKATPPLATSGVVIPSMFGGSVIRSRVQLPSSDGAREVTVVPTTSNQTKPWI